jgi:hypothetical protein
MPTTVIIQRVERDTVRTRECLPAQTTLLKIPYQAFGLCLAPTTSITNPYRISHASTSSCSQAHEKRGFARMDTVNRLLYPLASACQRLWLVHANDVCGGSHMLGVSASLTL